MRLQCAALLFPSAESVASETEVALWSDPDLTDKLPPAQQPPGGRSPMNVSRLGSRPPPSWRRARCGGQRFESPQLHQEVLVIDGGFQGPEISRPHKGLAGSSGVCDGHLGGAPPCSV
jgi:hypothetical protein